MTKWKAIKAAIQSRMQDEIGTPYGVQIQYDNDDSFSLNESSLGDYSCWCRFFIIPGADEQADICDNPRFRSSGVAQAQLLTPLFSGEGDIMDLAELVGAAFRATNADGITYRAPYTTAGKREMHWYRLDVWIPYFAEFFKDD